MLKPEHKMLAAELAAEEAATMFNNIMNVAARMATLYIMYVMFGWLAILVVAIIPFVLRFGIEYDMFCDDIEYDVAHGREDLWNFYDDESDGDGGE